VLSVNKQSAINICELMICTPCLKNVPLMACYNFDTHGRILMSFGRNVTDKVGNEKML